MNAKRVLADIVRLAEGYLPTSSIKKLKGFEPPLWEVDSGDFRIFHMYEEGVLWIRGVLRKTEQKNRLKSIR